MKMMDLTGTEYPERGYLSVAKAIKCHRHSNQGLGKLGM